jgi:hypothetical protein
MLCNVLAADCAIVEDHWRSGPANEDLANLGQGEVRIIEDKIMVADYPKHRVAIFSAAPEHSYLGQLLPVPFEDSTRPYAIVQRRYATGKLLVADNLMPHVYEFSAEFTYLRRFNTTVTGFTCMLVLNDGKVLTAGGPLRLWAADFSSFTQLGSPCGAWATRDMAIDRQTGKVFITDAYAGRVIVFNPADNTLKTLITGLRDLWGVALTAAGDF